MLEGVRIDKWLWTVRLFKTRSLAVEACKSGKVKINNKPVKASREIKIGEIMSIQQNSITKIVQIKNIIKNRVGAKLVAENMIDLTPQKEYDKLKLMNEINYEKRDRGTGRPTKKERRIITKLKDNKL